MHRTDDLELRELRDTLMDAGRDFVVNKHTRKAADFQQVATLGQYARKVFHLAAAHFLEVHRNAPGAGFGDDTVKRNHRNSRIAGLFHCPVQGCRRGCVDDDRIIALQNHVLNLRGLLGRLIFSSGESVSRRNGSVGHRRSGDLFPAGQHGLTPRVASIVI